MRIFDINSFDIDLKMQMYSLAILMKYFLKENKLPEFWVVKVQHLCDE